MTPPIEPFHVSKTSDGENHWFSAYDPSGGTSIPAKNRQDAYRLAASLNRSVQVAVETAVHTQAIAMQAGIYSLMAKVAVLEAALDSVPLISRTDTVVAFRASQDRWVRDVYNPARGATSSVADCCDNGKVWNNADPASGQWVPCEKHGEAA